CRAPASAARLAPHARVSTAYNIFGRHPRHGARKRIGRARERSPRVCKAWARVPAGIANARARSVAAPIVNREPQKSTAEGRKCGQLFSVEREGVSQLTVPVILAAGLKRGSNGNLRSGAEALGNPDYADTSVLQTVIREWADQVREAIRQTAGL